MPAVATVVFPDHMHVDLTTPNGAFAIVATPDAGFMSAASAACKTCPRAATASRSNKLSAIPFTSPARRRPGIHVRCRGHGKIGTVETRIVDVSGPASHCVGTSTRPAAASCANPTKPAARTVREGTTDHSNWETIEGISLSKLRMNKLNGETPVPPNSPTSIQPGGRSQAVRKTFQRYRAGQVALDSR